MAGTGRGRPSPFIDPEFTKSVATAFAAGLNRTEMCEMFNVKDPDTITRWRRDPRVKRETLKLMEDRVIQITRRIDSKIEQVLQDMDILDVRDLLAIRKEYLGGALRATTEKGDDEVIGEAQDWIDQNPDLAEQLLESYEAQKKQTQPSE